MLDKLNNTWVLIICGFLFIIIIRKIINLNKPFDEQKFIEQFNNKEKLKNKLNLDNLGLNLPNITSYYLGVNSYQT